MRESVDNSLKTSLSAMREASLNERTPGSLLANAPCDGTAIAPTQKTRKIYASSRADRSGFLSPGQRGYVELSSRAFLNKIRGGDALPVTAALTEPSG